MPVKSKEVGTIYVASQRLSKEFDVDADKLNNLRENPFAKKEMKKQQNLLFSKDPVIEAYRDNTPDKDLQLLLTDMMENVDYTYRMITAFDERMYMGIGIFNDVWEKVEGEWVIADLRHLPSYSFSKAPKNVPIKKIYNKILQGIIVDEKGSPVYYQTDMVTNAQELIPPEYLTVIKDPADPFVAGYPGLAPLAPILEMMAFTWNADMQYVNRVGAPPLFIRITAPRPASAANSNVGDVEYSEMVLQNWGKDNQYPLRENMEPIFPPISDTGTRVTEIQNALQWIIVDFFSPSSMVQKSGGTLVGGSSAPEAELLQAYIAGHHRWLCGGFNQLLKKYLLYNNYGDEYSAYITIPTINLQDQTLELEKAKLLYVSHLGHPNDILKKLQIEPKTDEEFAEIAAVWKVIEPEPLSPFGGGGGFGGGIDEEEDGTGMAFTAAEQEKCPDCGGVHAVNKKPIVDDPLKHLRVARGHLSRQPVEDKAMRNISAALDVLGADLAKAMKENKQAIKDQIEPI